MLLWIIRVSKEQANKRLLLCTADTRHKKKDKNKREDVECRKVCPNLTKALIGGPTDFHHLVHMGLERPIGNFLGSQLNNVCTAKLPQMTMTHTKIQCFCCTTQISKFSVYLDRYVHIGVDDW